MADGLSHQETAEAAAARRGINEHVA